MGMNRHDAYYEPEDDQDAIALEEAEHEAWKLMQKGQKWDYQTVSALSEVFSDLGQPDAESLQAIIDTGDFEKIGRKLMTMAMDKMEAYALDDVL